MFRFGRGLYRYSDWSFHPRDLLRLKIMSETKTIGFGVIGAGLIGSLHARNIASRVAGAELVGVADINLEVAEKHAYGNAYATDDLNKLLDDPDIDAVLIASKKIAGIRTILPELSMDACLVDPVAKWHWSVARTIR